MLFGGILMDFIDVARAAYSMENVWIISLIIMFDYWNDIFLTESSKKLVMLKFRRLHLSRNSEENFQETQDCIVTVVI